MEGRKPKKVKVKGTVFQCHSAHLDHEVNIDFIDPDHIGTYRLLGRRPITTLEVHSTLFADGLQAWDDKETKKAGERKHDPQKWALTPGIITGTPPDTDNEATEVNDNQYESPSVQERTETGDLDQPDE